jgi:hypothetical protein
MARKPAIKSKAKTGAKTVAKSALAGHGKDAETSASKAKSGFGKRSMAAGAARTTAAKSKPAKSHAKPARKSVIGKAVEAVTSTVSNVAEGATSLFKRRSAKSH